MIIYRVDIFAPGVAIKSTYIDTAATHATDCTYASVHVTGLVIVHLMSL